MSLVSQFFNPHFYHVNRNIYEWLHLVIKKEIIKNRSMTIKITLAMEFSTASFSTASFHGKGARLANKVLLYLKSLRASFCNSLILASNL
jgi:hypothetical protein